MLPRHHFVLLPCHYHEHNSTKKERNPLASTGYMLREIIIRSSDIMATGSCMCKQSFGRARNSTIFARVLCISKHGQVRDESYLQICKYTSQCNFVQTHRVAPYCTLDCIDLFDLFEVYKSNYMNYMSASIL